MKVENYKKENIAKLIFDAKPKPPIRQKLQELGFPKIDDLNYTCNYWQIEDLIEIFDDIEYDDEFVNSYRRYLKFIEKKRQAVEKRIAKANKIVESVVGNKLFEHQEVGIRFSALRNALIIADEMGLGKAQSNDSLVLTDNGWLEIAALNVGDKIFDSFGKLVDVLGVFPQGKKDIYEIEFDDGSKTECCLEHLWAVKNKNDRSARGKNRSLNKKNSDGFRVLQLKEIVKDHNKHERLEYSIPITKPVAFCKKNDGFLHPYLLGMILGDGCISSSQTSVSFANKDNNIIEYIKGILPNGYYLKKISNTDSYRILSNGTKNNVIKFFKDSGLWGKNFSEKFIPYEYLYSSIEDRISLLQGYMDADGTILKDGGISFCTGSHALYQGISFIVRSLGGVIGRPQISTINKSIFYRSNIILPKEIECFKAATSKIQRLRRSKNKLYQLSRYIKNINFIGVKEATCIKIDSKDSLYLTNDFLVTHNTAQAVFSIPNNVPVMIVCSTNAKHTWRKQFKLWVNRETEVLEGRNSFKFPNKGEVVILNYDILPEDLYEKVPRDENGKELGKAEKAKFNRELKKKRDKILDKCPDGMVVIIDEAHRLKNRKTLRSKRFSYISEKAKSRDGKVWALTGTPLNNKPDELYAILSAIGAVEESFGSYENFRREFGGALTDYGIKWGKPRDSAKYFIANVMLRRVSDDVFDLPELKELKLPVELDEETKKICDDFESLLEELGISLEEAIDLAQNPNSPLQPHFMKLREQLAIAKIPAVQAAVEECEDSDLKVIVASCHVKPVDFFGAREGWSLIKGGVSAKNRSKIEDGFQKGLYRGLALSQEAGGESLTLTAASRMIIVDPPWTPGTLRQVIFRIKRPGQKNKMVVLRAEIDHPLEKRINEILEYKQALIEATVEKVTTLDISNRKGNLL